MQEHQSEVIIVGGGIAGIIAAYELIEAGHRVLLIDRDKEKNLGGLAKWAFGGMFFVDSNLQRKRGIKDSIDLAMKDWWSFAEFDEGEYWGKKWAEQYIHLCTPHGYDWMRDKGFSFFPALNWVERGTKERRGNSVARFHMVYGTGWELTYRMIRLLQQHNKTHLLSYLFEHRVEELLTENEEVVGVRGQNEATGQPFLAKAERTIVATGGINGSIEKVKEHWDRKAFGTPPETILNGAHPYAIGDLHQATEAIAGHVVNLEKQWNYAAGIHHPNPPFQNHALSLVPCKSAIWLNYRGERIGPRPLVTATDTRWLVEQICQEEKKYSWQVLNKTIALKELAISGSESNPLMRDKKFLKFIWQTLVTGNKKLVAQAMREFPDVVVANTMEELVEKMNDLQGNQDIKLDRLRDAIRQYDEQVALGPEATQDWQLQFIHQVRQFTSDKLRTCNFQSIMDPKAMPLIAIREFVLSRKSLGGIQTDLEGRVLTRPNATGKQNPIPNLYAIGEAAGFGGGGMHGRRSLEGTFLGGCLITARVAAASIKGKTLM
ncbi:MAG TPA: FAD-binding dehydrogenase [Saprospiraceae bacterium]|nr:FAD-binding dehydrogenase [Saprospiraceae bacterium]